VANREVNLTKRVRTANGYRYCPAVLSGNGRIKPDVVRVGEREEKHPEGAYYIEWREDAKRIRLSVGKDAQAAAYQRLRKEDELNNGTTAVPDVAVWWERMTGRAPWKKSLKCMSARIWITYLRLAMPKRNSGSSSF
jgi:hypothetical protein